MSIVLWIVQVLLALAFIMAGSMKLVTPIAELAEANMTFVNVFPEWFVRFLGVAEVAGGIGLIVPAATRIMPRLTPLAAFLLGIIMVGAVGYHLIYDGVGTIGPPLVFTLLLLFVAWGRGMKAPILPR